MPSLTGKRKTQAGSSLIESLLSVGILMIALVGPLALVQKGLTTSGESINETVALYLAQDALEFVKNVHSTNQRNEKPWLSDLALCSVLGSGPCTVDTTRSQALSDTIQTCGGTCALLKKNKPTSQYGHQSGWEDSIFTRSVTVTDVVVNTEANAVATVSWDRGGTIRTVTLSENLYNLQAFSSLSDGLVGHWKFDNDATDSSVSLNDGVLLGAPIYYVDDGIKERKVGSHAIDFIAPGDGVDMGDVLDFGVGSFSIAFWVQVDDFSGAPTLVDKNEGGAGKGYRVLIRVNGLVRAYINDGTLVSTPNDGTALTSEWSHVAVTFDRAGDMTRYINGVVDGGVADITMVVGSIDNPVSLTVAGSVFPFDFSLDDVRIYDRVLSPAEVLQLYQLGS